jgi:hypothetical protein
MQSLGLVLMSAGAQLVGFVTQKSVRMTGIECPFMIQPKLPIEKSARRRAT